MIFAVESEFVPLNWSRHLLACLMLFGGTAVAVFLGLRPFKEYIRHQEYQYNLVLRHSLLLSLKPRAATIIQFVGIALLMFIGYGITEHLAGCFLFGAAGFFVPSLVIRHLRRRRLNRLEEQLVGGIQTLASGVRAGLNLVQSMQLVARDGPIPLRQEFAHMLREYEFGMSLEDAMNNAAARIGSGDFRLLFAALLTHRERGGDLGETLDRIAESIREIQRLENRVKTLTAQGRATARWLGAMPGVVLAILYFIMREDVQRLFVDDMGKLILVMILILNILGFLWVRKIVAIDI